MIKEYIGSSADKRVDIIMKNYTRFMGIVDGGKFDWEASGKFPSLTEPNPSYHGVVFTQAAGPAAFVTKIRAILLRDTGATISPIHSFIFLQGLETLSLRVERHVENALKVVKYLENHPQVEKVHHPSVSDDEEQKRLYAKYFPEVTLGGSLTSSGTKVGNALHNPVGTGLIGISLPFLNWNTVKWNVKISEEWNRTPSACRAYQPFPS